MRSMTGFGRGYAKLGNGRLVLEIRSVNHRFLDIRTRAPRELAAAEVLIERLLRGSLARGHCTVSVSYEGSKGAASEINTAVLEEYLDRLKTVAESRGMTVGELVPALAGSPDLFSQPDFTDLQALESAVGEAFDSAIGKLIAMREAEGSAMSMDIKAQTDAISEDVEGLSELADGYAKKLFDRTRQRVSELLADTGIDMDQSRVEAEAALLADKADINEEITRLRSHTAQLVALAESDEPVGRRMEFLVQEMGREANTVGSKAASAELTHLVVEFKAGLERIRELVQNVE